jgi:hypothetical protein
MHQAETFITSHGIFARRTTYETKPLRVSFENKEYEYHNFLAAGMID